MNYYYEQGLPSISFIFLTEGFEFRDLDYANVCVNRLAII